MCKLKLFWELKMSNLTFNGKYLRNRYDNIIDLTIYIKYVQI